MRFVNKETEKEYTKFLEGHPRCNFQQSLEWGKVKSSWINEVVLATDEKNKIIGSISILIRKIPVFGTIMYSSRGPVCDIYDESVLKQLTDGVKELAKKYKAFVFKMEPDILSSDLEFRKHMTKLGYRIKDDAKNFREEIQPRYVFRLDIKGKSEDEIFKAFHSKTRYNIRLAIKKGVTFRIGERKDLKVFHDIMVETGIRDEFITRPLSYFEKMYDELGDHMKLLIAEYKGKPVAETLAIFYGNKTWYLYGASSNANRNVMANYVLQWEMIKMAISRKDDVFDFRGVSGEVDENHPQYGLYRFKKSFNAEFTEFVGEVYIPFRPIINSIYKISEKLFRTIRGFMSKVKNKIKH